MILGLVFFDFFQGHNLKFCESNINFIIRDLYLSYWIKHYHMTFGTKFCPVHNAPHKKISSGFWNSFIDPITPSYHTKLQKIWLKIKSVKKILGSTTQKSGTVQNFVPSATGVYLILHEEFERAKTSIVIFQKVIVKSNF